jgi:hypothetical protein
MTPKEKAEELVRKYYTFGINKEGQTLSWLEAKQCALICVDIILQEIENIDDGQTFIPYDYWEEVKKEIELL